MFDFWREIDPRTNARNAIIWRRNVTLWGILTDLYTHTRHYQIQARIQCPKHWTESTNVQTLANDEVRIYIIPTHILHTSTHDVTTHVFTNTEIVRSAPAGLTICYYHTAYSAIIREHIYCALTYRVPGQYCWSHQWWARITVPSSWLHLYCAHKTRLCSWFCLKCYIGSVCYWHCLEYAARFGVWNLR